MTRFLLITFSLLLIFQTTFACDCNYGGNFLKMQKITPLVALIKVTKYLTFDTIYNKVIPMSMEVEVISKYKGKETRKTFTVWGDNGILCRPYLSEFKEGKYYVIAFDSGNYSRSQKDEKDTDYSITNCGCYWLSVDINKQTATGDINSKDRTPTTIDLRQLQKEIKKTATNKGIAKSVADSMHFNICNSIKLHIHRDRTLMNCNFYIQHLYFNLAAVSVDKALLPRLQQC